jgi:hypothetical protein
MKRKDFILKDAEMKLLVSADNLKDVIKMATAFKINVTIKKIDPIDVCEYEVSSTPCDRDTWIKFVLYYSYNLNPDLVNMNDNELHEKSKTHYDAMITLNNESNERQYMWREVASTAKSDMALLEALKLYTTKTEQVIYLNSIGIPKDKIASLTNQHITNVNKIFRMRINTELGSRGRISNEIKIANLVNPMAVTTELTNDNIAEALRQTRHITDAYYHMRPMVKSNISGLTYKRFTSIANSRGIRMIRKDTHKVNQ